MRQPGTNTVEIVDAIKKVLPWLRDQIPGSVSMDILYDRTTSIRASIEDVEFTLVLTIGLVVAVIFIFLRNLPATIIPSLALPTSIIGTFAAMYLLGFSLNNLTLMALTLSVGFVVDDAVVVLDHRGCQRHFLRQYQRTPESSCGNCASTPGRRGSDV